MAGEHDLIPEAALAWWREGRPVAIATVVETWGSAPRPAGAQLAIAPEAEMAGSVSGGCVEGAVVAEGLAALADGRPRLVDYGVSDADAFAAGLACGGRIRVLVEPVGLGQGPAAELIERLVAARAARAPVVYAVRPEGWERRLVSDAGRSALAGGAGGDGRGPLGVRRRLVSRRAQPAAPDRGRRGRAYRAGAGADGADRRIRRHRRRPPRGLRQR